MRVTKSRNWRGVISGQASPFGQISHGLLGTQRLKTNVDAINQRRAGGWTQITGNHFHAGGFAGPVRPQKSPTPARVPPKNWTLFTARKSPKSLVKFDTTIMVYEIGDAPNSCKLKRADPAWFEQGRRFVHAGSLLRALLKWQMIGPEEGQKYDDIGAIALLTSPVNTTRNADPPQKSRTPLASARTTRNH